MRYLSRIAIVFIGLATSSCGGANEAGDGVIKPIAQAEVAVTAKPSEVMKHIAAFSRRERFAVQEVIEEPRGNVEFSTRLFRDDISVTINQLRGEPIILAAFPLCVCEMNKRVGLDESARIAIAELQKELSALH